MDSLETAETALRPAKQPTAPGTTPAALPPLLGVPPPAPVTRRRHAARWVVLFVVLVVAVLGAYALLLPPAVEVVQPHRGLAMQAVYATGTVEPTVMIPIAARVTARLVELNVDEGDTVAKGQVLARLENDDLRRVIEVAAAEERYAKAELDRQSDLVGRHIVSRSVYDRARADWEKARAAREQAANQASYLELLAPADGAVIRRDGEIGQMIAANQTVLWLSCCAPLRISAEVDEEDIALVRSGQKVLIRSDDFPGKIFDGDVQAVTPKGDPVARTYRVRIALPADTPLMIGMTTETNIVLRSDERALLVPAAAVRQESVWRIENGRAVQRHVEVGARSANEIEIRGGIADRDWIVAAPWADLRDGQKVRPNPAAAP